ncbi:glycosyltransferase family 2 protein [Paenibacillus apii]|uniref:glycosyltransferase family 2 protein n=1 Tax=Paenibacillus apii TaxID=1850370 RepID=UPI00143A9E9D|nr:glycosyltransferase family 2 protein [Paenibacillus apii]NJJ41642.1 glycosyltransferase family 2 protein [Paenibacillus apii]
MYLSIIIPTYNLENYITSTLNSLLNQSKKNFEVIIIDDGSIDNTYHIIERFILSNSLFEWKLLKTSNNGVSAARNLGLRHSSGDYIVFLDGDDYVSNDFMQTINDFIQINEAEIICWSYDIVREDKTKIRTIRSDFKEGNGIEAIRSIFIKKNLSVWTASLAYKKKYLLDNKIYYTEQCINGEDQEFIYKTIAKATNVKYINRVLSFYVQRNSSITYSYNVRKFDAINALKRTADYFNSINNKDLNNISNIIMSNKLIENYFFNIKNCLFTKSVKIRRLISEIDKHYPNLNDEVLLLIKQYDGDNKIAFLEMRIFLFSPVIYQYLIFFKRKVFETLKRVKIIRVIVNKKSSLLKSK